MLSLGVLFYQAIIFGTTAKFGTGTAIFWCIWTLSQMTLFSPLFILQFVVIGISYWAYKENLLENKNKEEEAN